MEETKLSNNLFIKNWPPGHYYSPLPSIEELELNENKIWGKIPDKIPGIDLNTNSQIELLKEFEKYYSELPFKDNPQEPLRYYFANNFYGYGDAIYLYSMIRHLKPKNIIEIGSGFSSAVTLDTNEIFFDNSINCTFIEPYTERLNELLKDNDRQTCTIIEKNLQDVPLDTFQKLEANDILFIDSTHVAKINSDVNYILFEILPSLKKGVYIHIHDIGYPFEYPKDWLYEGRAWNEAYILRAFLQYNDSFKIKYFASYMAVMHPKEISSRIPTVMKNTGGCLWVAKER